MKHRQHRKTISANSTDRLTVGQYSAHIIHTDKQMKVTLIMVKFTVDDQNKTHIDK